jgi:hypothetical protein
VESDTLDPRNADGAFISVGELRTVFRPVVEGEGVLGVTQRLSRRAVLAGVAAGGTWLGSLPVGSIEPASRGADDPDLERATDGEDANVGGAARWLQQSQFIVSSLETGRVGYLEAWGGDEFGYSYTYVLSGQPEGVTVDADTGMLAIAAPLGVGEHRFQVIVGNHGAPAKSARFAVTLLVRQGVTASRSGNQILHKTYAVDSGDYGLPQGQDYTQVLMKLRRAIIQDQIAAGDGNLRATILFRRGQLYDYTNNRWPVGVQYITVESDPGYNPTRPRPRFRNVKADFTFDSEIAILICGQGSAFNILNNELKRYSPKIYTAGAGASTVRLQNKADAVNLRIGRWHLIASYDQQVGGYPPNIRYFDYVKVITVSGDSVTLDRRLRHLHREDFFEAPSDPVSIGMARIIPLDLGGAHGLVPSTDARLTIRQTFRGIDFVENPSTTNAGNRIIYVTDALDASFEDCIMPHPVPTVVEHMRYLGGSIGDSEPDKLISTLIADNVRSGEIGGATGVELYLMRNSASASMQISPRQFRAIKSTIDATHDTYLGYPITWSYNGPILSVELHGVTLRINPTLSDSRVMPSIKPATLALGSDASWRGNRLIIYRNSRVFLDWEVWLFEGMIVYTRPDNWGFVRRLSSPPDGSAIWADIRWMTGARPTRGVLQAGRGHSLTIDGDSRLEGKAVWGATSGGFMRQSLPSALGASSYGFPAGYPALEYGF